jgi:hypothetical protein
MQTTSDAIVLTAACITLATALVPLWKWIWNTRLVRHFDAKKTQHKELISQAKWYEERALRLDTLHKGLIYANHQTRIPDRFQLSEMISKLDPQDAEWARRIEDARALLAACQGKRDEWSCAVLPICHLQNAV